MDQIGQALSGVFQGASNAAGSAGSAFGTAMGDIGSALTSPASAAEAQPDFPQTQIDPSIAAQLAVNPPTPAGQGDQTGAQPSPAAQKTQPAPQGQQYAPDSAVAALKKAFQQIAAGRKNPYQPPPLSPTGPQSPQSSSPIDALRAQMGGWLPPGPEAVKAGAAPPSEPPVDPNNPPLPPPRPSVVGDPAEARTPPAGQEAPAPSPGGNITVRKAGAGAGPATVTTPPGTADESVPTKKDQPEPQPQPQPQPGPIMRDVTGGQSLPQLLPELAQIAAAVLPMLLGGMGGGRRGGGFFHHGGRGHWPYFAPGRGWQMHGYHPGPPWMPMHPRHMNALGFGPGQGGDDPFSHVMQALLGGGEDGQNAPPGYNPSRGGKAGSGDIPTSGNRAGYVSSGNPFTDALTSIESPNGNVVSESDKDSRGRTLREGGDPFEISQGYFQIQNYRRGGTWAKYAPQAGLDLNDHPNPSAATYEEQHKVAQLIPISEWGPRTKAALHRKFLSFPDSWTLGQLEKHFGGGATKAAANEPLIKTMPFTPKPGDALIGAQNMPFTPSPLDAAIGEQPMAGG